MRAGRLVAIVVLGASGLARAGGGATDAEVVAREPARAPAALTASGFVGVGAFGDTELGNSWAPEQVPGTAAVFGVRVGWLAAPRLVRRGPLALSLAVEAELALAASSTGDALADAGRASYAAPVLVWRAHALVRQPLGGRAALHAVLGGGGATVASSSPFMAKETDPLAYAGLGASVALGARWQLRLDLRQGVMPGRATDATRTSEAQLGVVTAFGGGARRAPAPPPPDAPDPADLAAADADTDGDGVPDRLDRCPAEREDVNGLADADGCPEPDPDADGVLGAADACPTEAEDIDRFADGDGCPDRDNDGDGIDDARDVCPNEAETRNGHADADGCPDELPAAVTRALASAAAVRFERGRARVTPAARRALQPVLAMLERDRDLAITIAGTPDRAGGEDLAKRRAEAVKWHLVDLGIAEDRIETSVGPAGGAAPIAVTLRR